MFGFVYSETLIIVLDNEEEMIRSAVHKMGLDISVTYEPILSSKDLATADSLRMLHGKFDKKDILILSSDIITDIDLKSFIQLYNLKDSTFQCLLSLTGSKKENLVPARKLMPNQEFDVIGIDDDVASSNGNDELIPLPPGNRLVYFEPDVQFNDGTVPLKRSLLEQ